MRVDLPFIYATTYRKPRDGKSTTTMASDSVSAEVPELDYADVELAAFWKERDETHRVMAYGGDVYRQANHHRDLPLLSDALGDISRVVEGQNRNTADRLFGWPNWSSNSGRILMKALTGETTRPRLPPGADIVSTTLERSRAEAQYMADGLLLLRGVVWHRIPGLLLHLSEVIPAPDPNLYITSRPYGYLRNELRYGVLGIQKQVNTTYFGLEQGAFSKLHNEDVRPNFRGLEVNRPDLLNHDGRSEFLARIMNYAVRTEEYRAGEMDEQEIGLWLGLRDAVNEWFDRTVPEIDEATVENLVAFISLREDSFQGGWRRRGLEIIETYRAEYATLDEVTAGTSISPPSP